MKQGRVNALILCLLIAFEVGVTFPAQAAPPEWCGGSGARTLTQNLLVTDSCIIRGDLLITGAAYLEIDYSANPAAMFVVMGNVTVEGEAVLWAHGPIGNPAGALVIVNEYNDQRRLSSRDHALIRLEYIAFRTQLDEAQAVDSRYMSYTAAGRSRMIVDHAALDTRKAWLLGNFEEEASLSASYTVHVPTEIYVRGAARVEVSGESTQTGLWLEAGSGTLDLPDQTQPFSWTVSRDRGLHVDWTLEIRNARPGLGVQVMPSAVLAINGRGTPATGEVTIGYFVVGRRETLSGLGVGLQNTRIGDRLTLNNVNLGPIAWQLYVGDGAHLQITDSVINEIGIFGSGQVEVSRSLLQLAVLAALAPGSTLKITDSQVWNQEIVADSSAQITLRDSAIYGALLHARSPQASITIIGGRFYPNPSGCSPSVMVEISTGQPRCNPFRAGGVPTAQGSGQITCTNVVDCTLDQR